MVISRYFFLLILSIFCSHNIYAGVEAQDRWLHYENLLKKIKTNEIDVNFRDQEGRSLLFMAMHPSRKVEEVEFLLNKGADYTVETFGYEPVFVSVSDSCQLGKLKLLIKAGVSINSKESLTNISLLHYASAHKNTDCMTFLLEKDADVKALDWLNQNAYFYTSNQDSINILWGNGLNLFEKNRYGIDVVHHSIIGGQPGLFKEVLIRYLSITTPKQKTKVSN